MQPTKVYDTIFDAFRHFAPNNQLFQLEQDNPQFFKRTNEYQVVGMGGHFSAFPGFPMQLFRGERIQYPSCKASIYRSDNPDDVIIDELRYIEFKNILLTFPQVQYAIEDNMDVDFLALAQHYELNTSLLDFTSMPEIAAYFATQQWINGIPKPVEDGIGCIRGINAPFLMPGNLKYHMIGLQCFQRPGIQAAYGIEMGPNDDLNNIGWRVYFKQNARASQLIHWNFHIDEDKVNQIRASERLSAVEPAEVELKKGWLKPEEEIADVADLIKTSKTISKAAIDEYGKPCADALERKGIKVSDKPVYSLSEHHRKELEVQFKGHPYGDVRLYSRLVYRG